MNATNDANALQFAGTQEASPADGSGSAGRCKVFPAVVNPTVLRTMSSSIDPEREEDKKSWERLAEQIFGNDRRIFRRSAVDCELSYL